MVVGGCHGSVAERWRLKSKALGSTPGGTTILSFPSPFTDSKAQACPPIVFD